LSGQYTLLLRHKKTKLLTPIQAIDTNHAQAQAQDIARALNISELELTYEQHEGNELSILFEKLALNTFNHKDCDLWTGKVTNNCPCVYAFGKRFYVRDIILRYLNIPKDKSVAKPSCKNKNCVNPYHFEYHENQNSKLTCGDTKLLLAYRSQGVRIDQIAKALNVHRSTVYRKLKHERLSIGASNHS